MIISPLLGERAGVRASLYPVVHFPPSDVRNRMRKPSVLVIFLTVFIDLIGFGIVLPLLPMYSRNLGSAFELPHWLLGLLIGFVQATYSLMQFLCAPGWGALSDRIGRPPVLALR